MREIMRCALVTTRTRVLVSLAAAIVLAALTAVLLLSGHLTVAVWLYGPYFLLSRLLPGGLDTLTTLVIVVAAYYFAASLLALGRTGTRMRILVVSVIILLNSLGLYAFLRMSRSG